jgi:UDP-N-acetylmuramoyl-L-alanyl-D-glutamate--2,6-diaminopimelate ligase
VVVVGEPGPVTAVASDSREVVKDALFVAVPGFDMDGHEYIDKALQAGAAAILVQEDKRSVWEPMIEGSTAAVVSVPDTRAALAQAAAGFYGHPARKLGVVGVTGTDGKTTTVHLIAHVLESAGRPSGFMSSVSFKSGDEAILNDTHMTTVESLRIQQTLADMVSNGSRYAVLEASSHGLALHRLDECEFDVAVFTTLGRDHLDFHETMEQYQAAKGRLFQMLDESTQKAAPKAAVVNSDDEASAYFLEHSDAPVIMYGLSGKPDVAARAVKADGLTTKFRLLVGDEVANVSVNLAGEFNVYNCLATAAVGLSQGLSVAEIVSGLNTFPGVPGRMENIDAGQPFRVIVDIASTPEALHRVLEVLRTVTEGRLCVVFGCAGERDEARRDGMGRAAGELADYIVLTNEDPRREDADAIIEQIAAAVRATRLSEGDDFIRLPDRRDALRHAFEWAKAGDTVLLAGKGTEQSIIVGTEHREWDEARVARELLGDA